MALDSNNTLFTVPEGCCPTYDADNPSYSPFANLEFSRIKNACKRDEQVQSCYFVSANIAHAICLWYWASRYWDYPVLDHTTGPIAKEEAIELLIRYCHRSREMAIFNLEHSKYSIAKNRLPSIYGEEISRNLDNLAAILCGDEE